MKYPSERLKLPLDDKVQYNFDDLNQMLEVLLGENGCPWDKEQTIDMLKRYLLEECYEVVEAVENGDTEGLKEELGDVLFQIIFITKLCADKGEFDFNDIIDGIVRKMVSRHTHIFGSDKANNPDEVLEVWEKNKGIEKKYKSPFDKLSSVPTTLPALMRADKVLSKASAYNENQLDFELSLLKSKELLADVKNWTDEDKLLKNGELLLHLSNISNKLEINTEFALTNAVKTYINRFGYIEEPH